MRSVRPASAGVPTRRRSAPSWGEGLSTGHEAMPEFVFQPDEIAAIVGYLDTLHNSR
jgi:hypothetical protein